MYEFETIDLRHYDEYEHYINLVRDEHAEGEKYFITSYGCQMNVHDSQVIAGMLEEMGYTQAENERDAAVVILNTCCIRDHAEQRLFGVLGALKPKNSRREKIIGVCGCMSQQEASRLKMRKSFPFLNFLIGTQSIHHLPKAIYQSLRSRKTVVITEESKDNILENVPMAGGRELSSFVNVMYGCNNFCSYCIVPYVRGRERSRDKVVIIDEVKRLVDAGTKEITLLGQNVNSYGGGGTAFAELIAAINDINGLERIRFMTSHPKDMSDELISAFGSCSKLCEHLHLPMQSGSDAVLSAMNRKYNMEKYLSLVEKLRTVKPNIELSTDMIVGFPGETDKDFMDSVEAMKNIRFAFAFLFAFSPRKGTVAYSMDGAIDEAVKKERLAHIMSVQDAISKEISDSYIGKKVEILSEGLNSDGACVGKTRTNKKVFFDDTQNTYGKLVTVEITNSVSVALKGKLC